LKKLRKPWIALAVVTAVLALAAYVTRPREPVYEGKRLSEWLEDVKFGSASERRLAEAAIKAIGTNALPTFTEMLGARDSKLKLWMVHMVSKQNFVSWEVESAEDRKVNGFIGLSILGKSAIGEFDPRAQAAVEQLREMTNDTNEWVRILATNALRQILGEDFERATPEPR
jgi:hypothetical protein